MGPSVYAVGDEAWGPRYWWSGSSTFIFLSGFFASSSRLQQLLLVMPGHATVYDQL